MGEPVQVVPSEGLPHLTEDGHFDLHRTDINDAQRYLTYQASYWFEPKRGPDLPWFEGQQGATHIVRKTLSLPR